MIKYIQFLADMYRRSLGDIEVARAWVDMLLSGYRSIFTRIASLRIPTSVLGPYFDRSYQLFGMCQGGSVRSICENVL